MIEDKTERAKGINNRLKKLYPVPVFELDYTTPFELLVASLLAAQNRDTTINKITPNVFRKYQGPADYVAVENEELEQDIHLSGFGRRMDYSRYIPRLENDSGRGRDRTNPCYDRG